MALISNLQLIDYLGKPTPFTMTTLFPVAPSNAASDRLDSIFKELRQNVSAISEMSATPPEANTQIPAAEVERLQRIITTLKDEIG